MSLPPIGAAPGEDTLAPFVERARAAIGRPYPYHFSVVLGSDADLNLPRVSNPAFYGSFDWHSAVHGHWCLVRALRAVPDARWGPAARSALAINLTEARLAAEATFLRVPGREGFERPYGLAWLLQLAAEVRATADPLARIWAGHLAPLETLAAARLAAWCEALPWPVRSGEHGQSAFALGLFHDWARDAGHEVLRARIAEQAVRLYAADRDAPVRYEPSAHDFLSPILGEADLLRRVTPPGAFGEWLSNFLPAPGSEALRRWLTPVVSPDPSDGKFAHLDGLNLSRAWMLEGLVLGLPPAHVHRTALAEAASNHRDAGIAGAGGSHYAGTHWLGSFAVYLLTSRGLR